MADWSKEFEDYVKNAREKAGKQDELRDIVNQAFAKVMDVAKSSTQLDQLVKKVLLFIKMLKSYLSGEYTAIPLRTIVTLTAGLVYFINPFDIIPDVIPGLGFVDDLAILMWIAGNLGKDIGDYEEFLKGNLDLKS
jgi:uncharacterized membrane protein YkvA (DUF1232 family)